MRLLALALFPSAPDRPALILVRPEAFYPVSDLCHIEWTRWRGRELYSQASRHPPPLTILPYSLEQTGCGPGHGGEAVFLCVFVPSFDACWRHPQAQFLVEAGVRRKRSLHPHTLTLARTPLPWGLSFPCFPPLSLPLSQVHPSEKLRSQRIFFSTASPRLSPSF